MTSASAGAAIVEAHRGDAPSRSRMAPSRDDRARPPSEASRSGSASAPAQRASGRYVLGNGSALGWATTPRGRFVHPSPIDWRDQVFYFLLPDRFSDGRERGATALRPVEPAEPVRGRRPAPVDGGGTRFPGRHAQGRRRASSTTCTRLGVTALWLGPVWKQRPDLDTYHGYGIQNFLDVDPRFGTRQDLRDLVDAAHDSAACTSCSTSSTTTAATTGSTTTTAAPQRNAVPVPAALPDARLALGNGAERRR
jgi:hypothetical protein